MSRRASFAAGAGAGALAVLAVQHLVWFHVLRMHRRGWTVRP